MIGAYKLFQARKQAKHVLRHARHIRNYREDVSSKADLDNLQDKENALLRAIDGKDAESMRAASSEVMTATAKIISKRRFPGLRENLEILIVAIAVAMGIRTYFVQPFKIPTGSMQPSLYGIHGKEMETRGLTDKFPLNIARWIITGEKYREVRVEQTGRLELRESRKPGLLQCRIGRHDYFVPKTDRLRLRNGDIMTTGTILWRGRQKAGDHVFVNKVVWNFMKPRRGDVMVFSTQGIKGLPESTHYIKRMCGMPGEKIGVDPPFILVNNQPLKEPESIRRIAEQRNGYYGYQLARENPRIEPAIKTPYDRLQLKNNEYLALGDNTVSSYDGRYWGAVQQKNLIGPAFLLYWPYTPGRWGWIKGH